MPSSEQKLAKHFQSADISFDYPGHWAVWEKESFERMRSFAKSRGIELLVMLKSKDGSCIFQVARQINPSSFDSLYRDKKEFADKVTSEGVEIMGARFVKYSVTIVDLADNQKAVMGYAERENGETGISYQLLSAGYEYNVNFIYQNASTAETDEKLREQIMGTFNIVGKSK